MLVGELVKPQNFGIFRRLLDAKIWSRQAEDFSPIDLEVLFAKVREFESMEAAQRACDIVVLKLTAAELNGEIGPIRVQKKSFYKPLLTQHEFEKRLSTLPQARQDCILFALEMQWPIDSAIALERQEIKAYLSEMNERALKLVNDQPISMFKRNVFWEYIQEEPRMLISLRHQVLQTFNRSWEEMLRQYDANTGKFVVSVSKEEALFNILNSY